MSVYNEWHVAALFLNVNVVSLGNNSKILSLSFFLSPYHLLCSLVLPRVSPGAYRAAGGEWEAAGRPGGQPKECRHRFLPHAARELLRGGPLPSDRWPLLLW